jgi:PAS domain-containing protein
MNQQVSQKLRDDIDGLPGSTACRDAQGVYQYVNAAYGRLMGLTQPLDIVGRTVFDLPCDAAACAEAFQEHDRLVMSSGRAQKVLDIHPYADGQWGVYVVSKKPWFNERREIIGTLCRGVEITDAYTMAISTQLAKFTGHRQDSYLCHRVKAKYCS